MSTIESQIDRWYVRCVHCLSIGAVETNPHGQKWVCGVCAGPIEVMGKVVVDHLETEQTRSACDARCTNARGPLCVCHCHCANHGTGRIVRLVIKQDIPTIEFINADAALKLAMEYLNVAAAIEKRMNTSGLNYYRLYRVRDRLKKARDARKHDTRMKRLHEAITSLDQIQGIVTPSVGAVAQAPLGF